MCVMFRELELRNRINDKVFWEIILVEQFKVRFWRVLLRNLEFILYVKESCKDFQVEE